MGQKVYRCGSSYSQNPCANGVAVDVEDPRTAAQKTTTDANTQRDASTANAMEKARLAEAAPKRTEEHPPSSNKDKKSPAKHKKKEPEFFTAKTITDKSKKSSSPGHQK